MTISYFFKTKQKPLLYIGVLFKSLEGAIYSIFPLIIPLLNTQNSYFHRPAKVVKSVAFCPKNHVSLQFVLYRIHILHLWWTPAEHLVCFL